MYAVGMQWDAINNQQFLSLEAVMHLASQVNVTHSVPDQPSFVPVSRTSLMCCIVFRHM